MPDGYYSNVSLLLHANGTDGSKTFTDNSPVVHTVTANGNAQIDTAQKKYGSASALFDATTDWLSVPDHASLQFGSGNFTVEMWIRPNALSGLRMLYSKRPSGASKAGVNVFHNGTTINAEATTDGGVSWNVSMSGGTLATGTWYHVAVTRSGNNWYLFLDGTQLATTSVSGTVYDAGNSVFIGAMPATGTFCFNGWIDDLRVTKGIARYTAGFTPPAAEFPDSGYSLTADAGSFTFTGAAASLKYGRRIAADTGPFVLTGGDAGLRVTRTLAFGAGSFALTGSDASLKYGRLPLTASAGSFIFTGSDVSLRYSGEAVVTAWTVFEVPHPITGWIDYERPRPVTEWTAMAIAPPVSGWVDYRIAD